MRIALLCPSLGEYAGIGRIAETLAREFAAAGHEVAFVCRPPPPHLALPAAPRLEIPMHQLPRRAHHLRRQVRLLLALARAFPALRGFVAAHRVDVVLTLAISTFAPFSLLAARLAPLVVSLQGGEPSGRLAANPSLFRRLLRRSAGVVACATSLERQARALEPGLDGRIETIPNGVDPAVFASAPPHPHSRPYVLAAGRLVRQKGFDVLIEAAALVERVRRGDLDVLIAGDGPEAAALRTRAERLGIPDRVRFLGAADTPALASLYRGARLVAVPSRWEGLPLVCLEAMASGCAVVASAVDGIPDAVVDGKTGLLVPADDPPLLAAAIERTLGDEAWTQGLGTAGRARARERFAWPELAQHYARMLQRAVQGTPTSP